MKKLIPIFIAFIVFSFAFISSFDLQTIFGGGGDDEMIIDFFGDSQLFFMGSGNTAPGNFTNISLLSVDGANKTTSNLNCSTTIFDIDAGAKINVTVRWYNNTVQKISIDYNNSYLNNTIFSAILNSSNTSKNEGWSCSVRLYDGATYSAWMNSSNLTILNSLPTVTLSKPDDDNITTNRTPEFTWAGSDADSDSLTYSFNLTCYNNLGGSCTDDNRLVSASSPYTLASITKYFADNNYYYNWTVKASDDGGSTYGSWVTPRRMDVNSLVTISLPVDSVNFGTLAMDKSNDTTDDSPPPFIIQNDGNCMVNITLNSTDLWTSVKGNSSYYKYKIDFKPGEENSFNWTFSQTSWAQVPNSTQWSIMFLNWSDSTDSAEIDLNITVPPQESAGDKSATIYFESSLGE